MAALLAHRSGRALYVLRMGDTPAAGEMEEFLALWTREAMLLPAMLLLQWESDTPTAAARRLVEQLPAPLVIATRDPLRLHRAMEQYEVNKAGPVEQREMWEAALGPVEEPMEAMVLQVAQQFRLSAETIVRVAARAQDAGGFWAACRAVARPTLAERIVPAAGWQDLILPELQMHTASRFWMRARSCSTSSRSTRSGWQMRAICAPRHSFTR